VVIPGIATADTPAKILARTENRRLRNWLLPAATCACFPFVNMYFAPWLLDMGALLSEFILLDLILFAVVIADAASRITALLQSGIHLELGLTRLGYAESLRVLIAGGIQRWTVCIITVELIQGLMVTSTMLKGPQGISTFWDLSFMLILLASLLIATWFHIETIRLAHIGMLGLLRGQRLWDLVGFMSGVCLIIFFLSAALFFLPIVPPLLAIYLKRLYSSAILEQVAKKMEAEPS
jgi:hypothetical protein